MIFSATTVDRRRFSASAAQPATHTHQTKIPIPRPALHLPHSGGATSSPPRFFEIRIARALPRHSRARRQIIITIIILGLRYIFFFFLPTKAKHLMVDTHFSSLFCARAE